MKHSGNSREEKEIIKVKGKVTGWDICSDKLSYWEYTRSADKIKK